MTAVPESRSFQAGRRITVRTSAATPEGIPQSTDPEKSSLVLAIEQEKGETRNTMMPSEMIRRLD